MRPHPEHRILRAALIASAFLGGVVAVLLLAWLHL